MTWLPDVVGVLALGLVMLIGFAAQRAGICTVNAVAEVMTSGRAYLVLSWVKAALWAAAIYGLFVLLAPVGRPGGFQLNAPPAVSIVGAFVFGVGAAVNGACAMSTLQRLTRGDISMAFTLLGLAVGVMAWSAAAGAFAPAHPVAVAPAWPALGAWAIGVIAVVAVLAAIEAVRLWRTRPREPSLAGLAFAPTYRLSTAALVIGIAGGLVFGLKGAWSWTNYVRGVTEAVQHRGVPPGVYELLLFVALLAGMLLSALLHRSLRLRPTPWPVRMRRFAGGVLMGIGTGAIPGGNDALLLTGLPTLSLWALGAFLALLAGVTAGLLVMKASGVRIARVDCTGDICRADAIA